MFVYCSCLCLIPAQRPTPCWPAGSMLAAEVAQINLGRFAQSIREVDWESSLQAAFHSRCISTFVAFN